MDILNRINPHIREMKPSDIRMISKKCRDVGGINLGQGFCDIPTPDAVKQAAIEAIEGDKNIYAPHNGIPMLREALAKKIADFNKVNIDPETQIVVSSGATGAYISTVKALFQPGDEIILFEPFYGYHKRPLDLFGMKAVTIEMDLDNFTFDLDALKQAITPKTKGIVICTPGNPSGKVFSKEELIAIGELANQHDLYIIADEIYEYITYPGFEHISIASLNDFAKRTITISGFSKVFNITGWRLGYIYAPQVLLEKICLVHDLFYICAPAPLQYAMVAGLQLDDSYYQNMRDLFLKKRDSIVSTLKQAGYETTVPQGAYYLMVDFSSMAAGDNSSVAHKVLEQTGVATVPGKEFYSSPEKAGDLVRVCYAVDDEQLKLAMQKLLAAKAN